MPWMLSDCIGMPHNKHLANRISTAVVRAIHGEAGAGIILMVAAAAAMLAANSSLAHGYHALFHDPLGWSPVAKLGNLHMWINDALMAVFFFVVGLELKREVLDGQLSTADKRRLPVLAAAAGMALPALIYLTIAGNDATLHRGWAIPAATDIAFALGVLALLGKRVPPSLRLFLLTVAIVDDLGSVAIIALFYTESLDLTWLAAAAALLSMMIGANRVKVTSGWFYAVTGVALWYFVLHSGVHATVAGVLAAFTVPLRNNLAGDSLLLRLEHALAPVNGYLIVPLFGFANAGVSLYGKTIAGIAAPLPLAVAAALFLGKQAGICGAVFAAERIGFAPRPAGASWMHVWGIALLCGIGFTMSLFISALAFPDHPALIDEAKMGILLGSLASGLLGYTVLRTAARSTV